MIQSISIYSTSFKGNQDSKYNKYGEQKSIKDLNNPSNKSLSRNTFKKNESEFTKDKIKSLFLLLFGLSALGMGLLKK